jgi:superfamily II DNA helicase RecQ
MPTYTDIARAAALLGVREVKPYITALETKVKELEERLHKIETTPNVAQPQTTLSAADERLFNILKAKRMQLARRIDAPAYVVATNKTLLSMIERKPRNLSEMLTVVGFGTQKTRLYGRAFLIALTDNYVN